MTTLEAGEAMSPRHDVDPAATRELVRMVAGGWLAMAIGAGAELRLADLVADAPKDITTLASASGLHAGSLQRLLRALTAYGLFTVDEQGRYATTPVGAGLRSDVRGSVRNLCALRTAPWFLAAWGELANSVRTGETGFMLHYGRPVFAYLGDDAEAAGVFNAAMTEQSAVEAPAVLGAYDFSAFRTIVDVGGGRGGLLAAILGAHPQPTGVLFDAPSVVQTAAALSDPLLRGRVRSIGGDFFESVPEGGDLYILKSVIHDWDDNRARDILVNCRHAAQLDSRLLLIERVLPEVPEPGLAVLMDLNMLAIAGGRERTAAEYGTLLDAAGFRLARVIPTGSPTALVEAVPV